MGPLETTFYCFFFSTSAVRFHFGVSLRKYRLGNLYDEIFFIFDLLRNNNPAFSAFTM